jgi:uncharacterized protein (TIGR02597 family)
VTKTLLPPAVFYSTKPKSNRKSYLVMKPIISFALLGALFAVGAANAAVTDPVGYVSLGDTTVGQPAVKANTEVRVSIPLDKKTVFAGTVASVAGNVITISGTPGLGNLVTVPHVVKIGNGAAEGLTALVTASTASSVTVSVQPGDSLAGVVAGTELSIQEAWTVSSFLSGGTLPTGTQLFAFSGAAPGIVIAPDLIFEFDGTGWVDTNTFESANNVVLYPGEGYVLRNPTATPIASLVLTGEVPTANHRVVVSNLAPGVGQDIPFGFISPVDEIVGVSGLGFTSGDQILSFSNSAAGVVKAPVTILEYDGTGWVDTDTFESVTGTFPLKGGVSYVYRRATTAPGGDIIWSNEQTYIPTL